MSLRTTSHRPKISLWVLSSSALQDIEARTDFPVDHIAHVIIMHSRRYVHPGASNLSCPSSLLDGRGCSSTTGTGRRRRAPIHQSRCLTLQELFAWRCGDICEGLRWSHQRRPIGASLSAFPEAIDQTFRLAGVDASATSTRAHR